MFDEYECWKKQDQLIDELLESGALEEMEDVPFRLPPDLDQWEPGLALAAVLSSVSVDSLDEEDRILYLKASERLNAAGQARTFRAMTSITDAYEDLGLDTAEAHRGAALEIRSALRLTPRAAENELDLAHSVRTRVPALIEAMEAGRLDRNRARVLSRHTEHLSAAGARTICAEVLPSAGRLTTGQLTEAVRATCLRLLPEENERQRVHARNERRVESYPNPDGTVTLILYGLDPVDAREILDRLTRLARQCKGEGESRTMDQLRSDIAVDDLRGHAGPVTQGSVHITVDLATLAELSQNPGDLAGYGPVVADIARQVTEQLGSDTWQWTVTGDGSGMPICDGTTRRRPTASQVRRVRAGSRTCAAPGCRAPAVDCDLDHIRPWVESKTTSSDQLAPCCEKDHCTRHLTGWKYERLPNGDFVWTSPLGVRYTTSGVDPP